MDWPNSVLPSDPVGKSGAAAALLIFDMQPAAAGDAGRPILVSASAGALPMRTNAGLAGLFARGE